MIYIPPDILCLIYGYVKPDFVRWITQCARHGDLQHFQLLLQRPLKVKEIRALGLFRASLRNPNCEIAGYLVQQHLAHGQLIDSNDPFIVAIKYNNVEIANLCPFPCSQKWVSLLHVLFQKSKTDALMQYCFKRDPAFRDFGLLEWKDHSAWGKFIILTESTFTVHMLFETGKYEDVFDWFLFNNRSSKLFPNIWLLRFGNEFDANNNLHCSIFEQQLTILHYDALTFMAQLTSFCVPRKAQLQFTFNCMNQKDFLDWVLMTHIQCEFVFWTDIFWMDVLRVPQPLNDNQQRLVLYILDTMSNDTERLTFLQHRFAFAECTKNMLVFLSITKQWTFMLKIMDRYKFKSFGTQQQCTLIVKYAVFQNPLLLAKIYRYVQPKPHRFFCNHISCIFVTLIFNTIRLCCWLVLRCLHTLFRIYQFFR